MKFGCNWTSGFRGEVVWNCGRTDGRRTTGLAYTISSLGAFGSGELKRWKIWRVTIHQTSKISRLITEILKALRLCTVITRHDLLSNNISIKIENEPSFQDFVTLLYWLFKTVWVIFYLKKDRIRSRFLLGFQVLFPVCKSEEKG